jgi:DNA-binding winged helix-turn-helix (wHTH) protein
MESGGEEIKGMGFKQPVLIGQSGPLNGLRWVISEVLIIGRDSGCDIVIPDRQVSRFHARLSLEGEKTILEDLSSKNGTFLNNEQIKAPILLNDGDMFSVAYIQQFAFLSSDATLPLEQIGSTRKDRWGKLYMDMRSRRVWVGDKEIDPPLSVPQFRVLQLLYSQPGQVVSRQEMEVTVWGDEGAIGISEQALDALIRRLRERIANLDPDHHYLVTLRGHGVRLENPSQ